MIQTPPQQAQAPITPRRPPITLSSIVIHQLASLYLGDFQLLQPGHLLLLHPRLALLNSPSLLHRHPQLPPPTRSSHDMALLFRIDRLLVAQELVYNPDHDLLPPPPDHEDEDIQEDDERYHCFMWKLQGHFWDEDVDACGHMRLVFEELARDPDGDMRVRYHCGNRGRSTDCRYEEWGYERTRRRAARMPLELPDRWIRFEVGQRPYYFVPQRIITAQRFIRPRAMDRAYQQHLIAVGIHAPIAQGQQPVADDQPGAQPHAAQDQPDQNQDQPDQEQDQPNQDQAEQDPPDPLPPWPAPQPPNPPAPQPPNPPAPQPPNPPAPQPPNPPAPPPPHLAASQPRPPQLDRIKHAPRTQSTPLPARNHSIPQFQPLRIIKPPAPQLPTVVDDSHYDDEEWETREKQLLTWFRTPEGLPYAAPFLWELLEDVNVLTNDAQTMCLEEMGNLGSLQPGQPRSRPTTLPSKAQRMDDMYNRITDLHYDGLHLKDNVLSYQKFVTDLLSLKRMHEYHAVEEIDWAALVLRAEYISAVYARGKEARNMDANRESPAQRIESQPIYDELVYGNVPEAARQSAVQRKKKSFVPPPGVHAHPKTVRQLLQSGGQFANMDGDIHS
ncbi:hypothetical protein CALCODRAFT_484340 [Calocera cornea HHB12733]|uniref:Uncharacterized protein n=1 Tax=Calocera cornea HHB12733 TaxID=1353952 RepID=A0A165F230_9BASI|nr:hypothetical protein CALCODRAFT_484340 [Calocera cornea HHB12733]